MEVEMQEALLALPRRTGEIDAGLTHSSTAARGESSHEHQIQHRSTRSSKNVVKLWWKEILSLLFSLSCLAANIGVLAAIDQKPYETWHIVRVKITPNTLISIFSTFTKAGLLLPVAEAVVQLKWLYFQARMQRVTDLQVFDDASQGPLGSLQFLFKINIQSSLASLGAMIIIFALATGPFSQQTIRYPIRDQPAQNVSASISKATVFDPTAASQSQDDAIQQETSYLQDLNVAANTGIVRPAADTTYNCPSGSCSWPPFSSLALCNYCTSIANYTEVSCTSLPDIGAGYTLCSYTLSPDYSSEEEVIDGALYTPFLAWNLWEKSGVNTYQPNTLMNITQDFTVGFDLIDESDILLKLAIVHFNESYSSTSSGAPADIMPDVLRCELGWCAQYHNLSEVRNGILYDEPLFTVPVVSGEAGFLPDAKFIPAEYAQQFNATVQPFQIDNDFSTISNSLLATILRSEVFNSSKQLQGMTSVFQSLPNVYQDDYTSSIASITNTTDGEIIADPTAVYANYGRLYTLYYANHGSIVKTLDNVAASVTARMRSGIASSNVTGLVNYPVTYIQVIWPWFIFPAALVLLAAILLAMTISVSMGADKMVWKSSSLALLFHGLPTDDKQRANNEKLLDVEQMQKRAEQMWAQLSEMEGGRVRMKMF